MIYFVAPERRPEPRVTTRRGKLALVLSKKCSAKVCTIQSRAPEAMYYVPGKKWRTDMEWMPERGLKEASGKGHLFIEHTPLPFFANFVTFLIYLNWLYSTSLGSKALPLNLGTCTALTTATQKVGALHYAHSPGWRRPLAIDGYFYAISPAIYFWQKLKTLLLITSNLCHD